MAKADSVAQNGSRTGAYACRAAGSGPMMLGIGGAARPTAVLCVPPIEGGAARVAAPDPIAHAGATVHDRMLYHKCILYSVFCILMFIDDDRARARGTCTIHSS